MNRNKVLLKVPQEVADHPAAQAWQQLEPAGALPVGIESLRPLTSKKTPAYRLVKAGVEGSSVIAKLTTIARAEREHHIYTEVFPLLTHGTYRYYGKLQADEQRCWLFVEDVGGEPFSPDDPRHSVLAIEWLAELHSTIPRILGLPNRSLNYYYSRLHLGCDRIRQNLNNTALTPANRQTLVNLLGHADEMDRQRDRIGTLYQTLPESVIHGDFKKKNIQVRRNGNEYALMVFDWEDAGWGCPGIDMWELDLRQYQSIVDEKWDGFSMKQAGQLQKLGKLLWCCSAMEWASGWLLHQWADSRMPRFGIYESLLAESIRDIQSIK